MSRYRVKLTTALLFVAWQLIAIVPSYANAIAGEVLFAKGPNSVEREGPTTHLMKGSFIFEGDTINTGKRGRVQLLMVDGARISIRPESVFSIDTYELPGHSSDPVSVAANDGKASLQLLKGAFRSISGTIGKSHVESTYQVRTPVATLGIRGTDYTARLCAGDCGGSAESGNGDSGSKDGLYIGVFLGGVWIKNDAGSLDIDKNQFGYVASIDTPPEQLLAPPGLLRANTPTAEEEEEEAEEQEEDSNGDPDAEDPTADTDSDSDADADADPEADSDAGPDSETDDPTPDVDRNNSEDGESGKDESGKPDENASNEFNANRLAAAGAESASEDHGKSGENPETPEPPEPPEKPEQTITATNEETGDTLSLEDGEIEDDIREALEDDEDNGEGTPPEDPPGPPDDPPGPPEDPPGEGTPGSEISQRAAITNGGLVQVVDASEISDAPKGKGMDKDAAAGLEWGRWDAGFDDDGPLHWVAEINKSSSEVVLPESGTLEYSLSGGTDPTDNHGNTGSLDSGSLTADFTNQTVTNNLSISIGGDTWQATGQGTISSGTPHFDGTYEVTRESVPGGTGDFSGFFGGNPLPSGAPAGAGLGYILNSGDTSVSGAAAFSAK
jgi:hypothetical protein